MNIPVFSLGDRMAKARSHAGYSQQEMADQLHVSRVTLSRYESGDRTPNKELVQALAEATGVPVEWFYQDQTTQAPQSAPQRFLVEVSGDTLTASPLAN